MDHQDHLKQLFKNSNLSATKSNDSVAEEIIMKIIIFIVLLVVISSAANAKQRVNKEIICEESFEYGYIDNLKVYKSDRFDFFFFI